MAVIIGFKGITWAIISGISETAVFISELLGKHGQFHRRLAISDLSQQRQYISAEMAIQDEILLLTESNNIG